MWSLPRMCRVKIQPAVGVPMPGTEEVRLLCLLFPQLHSSKESKQNRLVLMLFYTSCVLLSQAISRPVSKGRSPTTSHHQMLVYVRTFTDQDQFVLRRNKLWQETRLFSSSNPQAFDHTCALLRQIARSAGESLQSAYLTYKHNSSPHQVTIHVSRQQAFYIADSQSVVSV